MAELSLEKLEAVLRQRAENARRFAEEGGPGRAYWEGRMDLAEQLLKELGFDE